MPTKTVKEPEYVDGDGDEDAELLAEEAESIAQAQAQAQQPPKRRTPRTQPLQRAPVTVKQVQPAPPAPTPQGVKRYGAFAQQATEGIVDVETREIVTTNIWEALADITERLERIETSLGSMMG